MKKFINLTAIVLLFLASSCKKDRNDTTTPPVNGPRVNKYTITSGGVVANSITLVYDDKGRRVKLTYADGSRVEFIYTGNTMIQKSVLTDGTVNNTYNYTFDALGHTLSYFSVLSPNYIYYQQSNAAGQPVSEIAKDNGVVVYERYSFYDAVGNLSKDSSKTVSGTTLRNYEYYIDKISTVENPNFGASFSGPGNKNSLKKVTNTSPANVVTSTSYNVPEFDAQGRIVKQSYTSSGTNVEFGYSYF